MDAKAISLTQKERGAHVLALRAQRHFRHLRGFLFAAVETASAPASWSPRNRYAIACVESSATPSIEYRTGYLFGTECIACAEIYYGFDACRICAACSSLLHKWTRRHASLDLTDEQRELVSLGWIASAVRRQATYVSRGVDRAAYRRQHDQKQVIANVLFRLPRLMEKHPFGVNHTALARETHLPDSRVREVMNKFETLKLAVVTRRSDTCGRMVYPLGYDEPPVRLTAKQARVFDVMQALGHNGRDIIDAPIKMIGAISGYSNVADKIMALEAKGLLRRVTPFRRSGAHDWEPPRFEIVRDVAYSISDERPYA